MTSANDVDSDTSRLYNALRDNKTRTAKLLLTHLMRGHDLSRKDVEESIKTLGLKKEVEATEALIRQVDGAVKT